MLTEKSFVLLLLIAPLAALPAAAEDTAAPIEAVKTIDGPGPWEPLGVIPVDEAGAGRRGYAIASEGANVAEPGAGELSLHTVAANNFFRADNESLSISQREETHTVALGYRRGFSFRKLPRIELGGQIQIHQRDGGFLNGFISGFESLWVSMTGHTSAKNQLRDDGGVVVPSGTVVTEGARLLYRSPGDDAGFGDIQLVAKALLHDATPSAGARIAARLVVNVSGASSFTQGNFAGVGVSIDRKLRRWAAFHGDVRANILLDRMSQWNLSLNRATFGFSAGPELKLTATSSISLQFDGNTTPFMPTGVATFDNGYGDITIGVSRRMRWSRPLLVQAYARENLNLPFLVRWNTDPDFAAGIKITALVSSGRR